MTNNMKNLWTKDKKDSFAQRWVKYWQSPARPTLQEIDFLRNYIGKQKKKRDLEILILGSTTEYRDLMFELGIKPTVIDFSAENYKVLSKRLKNIDSINNEIIIVQDWQNINIDKKFDIVLGHFALSINPFKIWDKILNSIHKHLKDDGLFITNNWITGDQIININDIIQEYNNKWKQQYTLFGSMMPKIYVAARDNTSGETHYSAVCKLINSAYESLKISKENYRDYENCGYCDFDFSIYISSEKDFNQFIKKYFIVQDRVILDPYPNAYLMPEWILKKK